MTEDIDIKKKEIQDLERRHWQLWAITLTLLLSLAVFIILLHFYWSTPEEGGRILDEYESIVFLLGFTGLVLLFCGYMVLREMEIKRLNHILMEERIRTVTLELEKLAAVGEMTAHIAHKVLNPLTTILSCVQISLKGEDEIEKTTTYLKRIEAEAERVERIIKGVLTYSRPSRMDKKPTDVNELLEEALDRVEHISSKNRVDIQKHLSSDLPKIMADRSQLDDAFIDVIKNALDAMLHGGNLTISTSVRSSELKVRSEEKTKKDYGPHTKNYKLHRDLIEVSVADTGIGISDENLDKVFKPFFTTRESEGGTGLGLAITHGIIRNHNGKIDITSKHGHGTTVTICLPA